MGCRTEPATIHIAQVLQSCISCNFSIFFIIYTTYRKEKNSGLDRKKNSIFFYNVHKLTAKKKITRLNDFCERVPFFTIFPKYRRPLGW